jgi:hypothetical protein
MAAEANEEKPINQQLEELWTLNGEKRGVPQGIRRLLNTAFTNVQVSSFPDLPSGKGKVNEEMQSFFFPLPEGFLLSCPEGRKIAGRIRNLSNSALQHIWSPLFSVAPLCSAFLPAGKPMKEHREKA